MLKPGSAGVLIGALLLQLLTNTPAVGAQGVAGTDPQQSVAQTTTTAPPTVYWGAFIGGWPEDTRAIDDFEYVATKRTSIIQWGQPWFRRGAYQSFQTSYYQVVRDRGGIPLVDWGGWDTCCGAEQPEFALKTILQGSHDAYLIKWARAAKAWGHPFFLRMNPEMNGWWSPWSEQVNGNAPGEYVAAWRHIVDLFRAEGANNVTWVWCPNIEGQYSTPLSGLYPGDDYVNWTCMDGYNWGTDRNNQWQTFDQVFGGSAYNGGQNTYADLVALAPSKPIMVGETAASENGGDKPAWITRALTSDLLTTFPQVRALLWFNWNANDPELSWDIASSPDSLAAFQSAIALPQYAANNYGTLDQSPIPPPDVLAGATTATPGAPPD